MPLSSVYEAVCPGLARTPLSAPSPLEVGEASTQAWHLLPAYAAATAAAAAAAAGLRGFLSSPLLCLASPRALASGPAQLVLGQAPSSFPLLSFQPCARQAPVPTGLPLSLPCSGKRQEIRPEEEGGEGGAQRPVGPGEMMDLKSVTSALIRASRALCPPLPHRVGCAGTALCPQAAARSLDPLQPTQMPAPS